MTAFELDRYILGASEPIRKLRSTITKLATSRLPVLIQGPTGAGKELVARSLHELSGRAGGFVALNVCAIAEAMFEDALFGHVRGAFTGAFSSTPGFLREADRGTAFLDEIGTLALTSQAKLLRALETGQFRPIGSTEDRRSDFRLLAATNQPLGGLMTSERFRLDLANRLAGVVIEVPSLAARLDDVPLLAETFLAYAVPGASLSAGAIRALERHQWPGNVRELKHVVEAAAALADSPRLSAADIEEVLDHSRHADVECEQQSFARRRLVELLESVQWDTLAAAGILRVDRTTVYRHMRRLGIRRPRDLGLLLPRPDELAG